MLAYLWKTTRGYHFHPWDSPYLKWRIETYWGLHAESIGFREFWGFVRAHHTELIRFLNWQKTFERRD